MALITAISVVMYFSVVTIHRSHAWTTGVRLWEQAWRDGSRKVRVYVNLNWAYQQIGDMPKAEYWAQEALKRAPNVMAVHLNRAAALMNQSKRDDAMQVIADILKQCPRGVVGWQQYAIHAEAAKDWKRAIVAYCAMLSIVPEDAETFNQVASLFWRLNDPLTALGLLQKAREIDPEHWTVLYNQAMLVYMMKRPEDARTMLRQIPAGADVPDELYNLLNEPRPILHD